jgi:hypothetical protein
LTHPGDLDGFWREHRPPDRDFVAIFLRALIGASQVKGGYHMRAAQKQAVPVFVERLENGLFPTLPRSMLSCAEDHPIG